MARDDGVTPIMANVLMVAVLAMVAIGVFLLLQEFEEAAGDPERRQGSFHVETGPGDSEFHIQYVKGKAIPLDDGFLHVTIDGARTEHPLADLSSQTGDGSTWTVGEAVCVVGPGDCLYADASTVEVRLIVGEDIMFHGTRELA